MHTPLFVHFFEMCMQPAYMQNLGTPCLTFPLPLTLFVHFTPDLPIHGCFASCSLTPGLQRVSQDLLPSMQKIQECK